MIEPSDKVMGNLGDLAAAGSLHEYLCDKHKEMGNVFGFWWMDMCVVSLAHPKWKSISRLFDRPVSLFAGFMPMIGEESIQYANGASGQARRKGYVMPAFSHAASMQHQSQFALLASRMASSWAGRETVNLSEETMLYALRAVAITSLGGLDESEIDCIHESYDTAWSEMERRVIGDLPADGDGREEAFQKALGAMHAVSRAKAADVANVTSGAFVSTLMASNPSAARLESEIITFLVGGFHTTGNLLAWAIFFVLSNDLSGRLRDDISSILGNDRIPNAEQAKALLKSYTGRVIDESLRLSVLAPWAARESATDIDVDGMIIPAGTPIIQPIGHALLDAEVWGDDVEDFRPDRFEKRWGTAFSPFGFCGGRSCPGQEFARLETATVLATIFATFDLTLLTKKTEVKRVYGLVTHPSVDITVKIIARE